MSFLSARDLRIIQKHLIAMITEIKLRNEDVKIPKICEAIENEISSLKSLGTHYFNSVEDFRSKEDK